MWEWTVSNMSPSNIPAVLQSEDNFGSNSSSPRESGAKLVHETRTAAGGFHVLESGKRGTMTHCITLSKAMQRKSPVEDLILYTSDRNPNPLCICTSPAGTRTSYTVTLNGDSSISVKPSGISGKIENFQSHAPYHIGMLPQTGSSTAWPLNFYASSVSPKPPRSPRDKFLVKESSSISFQGLVSGHPWLCESKPLSVVDIGISSGQRNIGDYYHVKVLGSCAIVGKSGLLSWHIIAVGMDDFRVNDLHNMMDVEVVMPGTMDYVKSWLLANYKKSDSEARFLSQQARDATFTKHLIREAHKVWQQESQSLPEKQLEGGVQENKPVMISSIEEKPLIATSLKVQEVQERRDNIHIEKLDLHEEGDGRRGGSSYAGNPEEQEKAEKGGGGDWEEAGGGRREEGKAAEENQRCESENILGGLMALEENEESNEDCTMAGDIIPLQESKQTTKKKKLFHRRAASTVDLPSEKFSEVEVKKGNKISHRRSLTLDGLQLEVKEASVKPVDKSGVEAAWKKTNFGMGKWYSKLVSAVQRMGGRETKERQEMGEKKKKKKEKTGRSFKSFSGFSTPKKFHRFSESDIMFVEKAELVSGKASRKLSGAQRIIQEISKPSHDPLSTLEEDRTAEKLSANGNAPRVHPVVFREVITKSLRKQRSVDPKVLQIFREEVQAESKEDEKEAEPKGNLMWGSRQPLCRTVSDKLVIEERLKVAKEEGEEEAEGRGKTKEAKGGEEEVGQLERNLTCQSNASFGFEASGGKASSGELPTPTLSPSHRGVGKEEGEEVGKEKGLRRQPSLLTYIPRKSIEEVEPLESLQTSTKVEKEVETPGEDGSLEKDLDSVSVETLDAVPQTSNQKMIFEGYFDSGKNPQRSTKSDEFPQRANGCPRRRTVPLTFGSVVEEERVVRVREWNRGSFEENGGVSVNMFAKVQYLKVRKARENSLDGVVKQGRRSEDWDVSSCKSLDSQDSAMSPKNAPLGSSNSMLMARASVSHLPRRRSTDT